MSRRFLDVLGLLSLLAIFAASVAALVAVKGRFTVTIAETRRESGPDPVALLRDDVQALRRDLSALVDAVRKERDSRHAPGDESFSLPSEAFEPDRLTKFEVIPSLSRVGFDATGTLHDFSGATSDLSGSLVARLTHPAEGTTAKIEAQAGTLDTGIVGRNDELATTLDAKAFPKVSFTLDSYVRTGIEPSGKSTGTATGRLTIHGVERQISAPVRVSLDEGKRLVIEGDATIRLTDFGVVPPKKFGIVAVKDAVTVWWAVRARAVGRAE